MASHPSQTTTQTTTTQSTPSSDSYWTQSNAQQLSAYSGQSAPSSADAPPHHSNTHSELSSGQTPGAASAVSSHAHYETTTLYTPPIGECFPLFYRSLGCGLGFGLGFGVCGVSVSDVYLSPRLSSLASPFIVASISVQNALQNSEQSITYHELDKLAANQDFFYATNAANTAPYAPTGSSRVALIQNNPLSAPTGSTATSGDYYAAAAYHHAHAPYYAPPASYGAQYGQLAANTTPSAAAQHNALAISESLVLFSVKALKAELKSNQKNANRKAP